MRESEGIRERKPALFSPSSEPESHSHRHQSCDGSARKLTANSSSKTYTPTMWPRAWACLTAKRGYIGEDENKWSVRTYQSRVCAEGKSERRRSHSWQRLRTISMVSREVLKKTYFDPTASLADYRCRHHVRQQHRPHHRRSPRRDGRSSRSGSLSCRPR